MRVVSVNAWSGGLVRGPLHAERVEPAGHKQRRTQALIAGLAALGPDVVILQECVPEPSFSQGVARALGYDHSHTIVNVGIHLGRLRIPEDYGEGHGLAVLARPTLKLRTVGARRLSGFGIRSSRLSFHFTPLYDAFAVRVLLRSRTVVVVNAHTRYWFADTEQLEHAWEKLRGKGRVGGSVSLWLRGVHAWQQRVRQAELRRLGRWVAALSANETPLVLGADLNLDPLAPPVVQFARQAGLHNVLPAVAPELHTWDPARNVNVAYSTGPAWADGSRKAPFHQLMAFYDGQPQCPDHLFCTRQFEIQDAGLALDEPYRGVFGSDHFGVWADLGL